MITMNINNPKSKSENKPKDKFQNLLKNKDKPKEIVHFQLNKNNFKQYFIEYGPITFIVVIIGGSLIYFFMFKQKKPKDIKKENNIEKPKEKPEQIKKENNIEKPKEIKTTKQKTQELLELFQTQFNDSLKNFKYKEFEVPKGSVKKNPNNIIIQIDFEKMQSYNVRLYFFNFICKTSKFREILENNDELLINRTTGDYGYIETMYFVSEKMCFEEKTEEFLKLI